MIKCGYLRLKSLKYSYINVSLRQRVMIMILQMVSQRRVFSSGTLVVKLVAVEPALQELEALLQKRGSSHCKESLFSSRKSAIREEHIWQEKKEHNHLDKKKMT